MKAFEVGDEVLVKMTVVGSSLEENDVYLEYTAHTGERVNQYQNWVNTDLVVENRGKPLPAEPMGLGAVVSAGLGAEDENTPAEWVRSEIYPMRPWSLRGADDETTTTWGQLARGGAVVVLSKGLET